MAMRTATALYQSYDRAADAVSRLEAAGIPHNDISIVSNDETQRGRHGDHPGTGAGASLGTVVGGGAGLLAGLGLLAIPGLGPVVAAGWLAATLVGAGVGAAAGGLVGSLTDAGIDHSDADAYVEGVRRGGTLVTVRADETQLARATQIMDVDGAVDLDERRDTWSRDGWTPGAGTTGLGVGTTGTGTTGTGTTGTGTTGAGTALADGAARARDAVERAGARVADAVTPASPASTTGYPASGAGTGQTRIPTVGDDRPGRRVRTY